MAGRDILHYRTVRLLGTGASGEAWLSRDLRLGREVVLKFLGGTGEGDRRRWLEEEARSLAALSHPGIAAVYALESDGVTSFLVTEYVDGENLRELLALGPLPVAEVVSMALALADALRHAHARGIVHRDIKPENILVDVEGAAHLVDFGVATFASRTAPPDTGVYGTVGYMSPQQARGSPADPSSDVYALGVVLVELLTGTRPEALPVRVGEALRARGVPAPLAAVVTRCLHHTRARRYRDGAALVAALDRAAVASGLRATAPRLHVRRHRAAYALAGVAVVLGAWFVPRHLAGGDPDRMRVMVAPLVADGGGSEGNWVGEAFARSLTQNLARARPLVVLPVDGGRDHNALREARARHAQWLVGGRIVRTGQYVRVSLDLTDTRNARTLWSDVAQGVDTEMSGMATRLAVRVAGVLHARHEPEYDYYMYASPSAALATSPLASEALGAVRRMDTGMALSTTERLVREFPDEPEARVLRAWAWMNSGWDAGSRSPLKLAFEHSLDSLRRIDPGNPWADVFASLVEARDGHNASAVDGFTRVLQREDLTPAARAHVLSLRGQAERDLGDSTTALLDLDTALRLDGVNAVTLVILSDALGTFGHPADALLRARQAVALAPDMAYANWILAQACGRANQWADAVEPARRASDSQPRHSFLAFEALALAHAGNGAAAEQAAHEAASYRESAWGDEYLARWHAWRGERTAALALLSRAVALGWKDPEILVLPEFQALRGDPAFRGIAAQVHQTPGGLALR